MTLLFGARSSADVYPTSLLPDEVEYVVATADGSLGHRGSVLDLVLEYEAWADQAFARRVAGAARRDRPPRRRAAGTAGRRDARPQARWRTAPGGRIPGGAAEGVAPGARPGRRSAAPRAPASAAWWPVRAVRSGPAARARCSRPTSSSGSRREGEAARAHGEAGRVIRTTRTPTVRRIKPAITPVRPKRGPRSCRARRRQPRPNPARPSIVSGSTGAAVDALGGRPVSLEVDLGRGLVLENPVIVASGPFGYGVEVADAVDLGAARRDRHPQHDAQAAIRPPGPRMADVPAGVLLGMGLQNPGIDVVIERYAPAWAKWSVPVIVSLAGESASDVADAARRLEGVPGVAGIELNLSVSNGSRGGSSFGLDAEGAASLVRAVRRATDLPLIAKLTPAASDPRSVARAVEDAGADAISAINTLPGARRGRRTAPARRSAAATAACPVRRFARSPCASCTRSPRSVDIPVIGIGGVTTIDDVLDFLAVGASAVGVGIAALADPMLPVRLADELADACRSRGAHVRRRPRRHRPAQAAVAAVGPRRRVRPLMPAALLWWLIAINVVTADRLRLRQARRPARRPADPGAHAVDPVPRRRRRRRVARVLRDAPQDPAPVVLDRADRGDDPVAGRHRLVRARLKSATVFTAVGGKAVLLKTAYDVALVGDDEPVPMPQRPWAQGVARSTTPVGLLEAYADLMLVLASRVGAINEAIRGAAAADPQVLAVWTKIQQERRIGAANIVRMAVERGGIRHGLDAEVAADVVWVLNDPGLYVRFVDERGWAPAAYRDWLAATLRSQLLG